MRACHDGQHMTDEDTGSSETAERAGPKLYRDRERTDGHFCPLVFDDADETAYRIVQLTAGQSFTTLEQALNEQLADLPDPTEAAAVILTPQADGEVLSAEVGTGTTMYGFRVDPEDLTGVSIAFSKLLQRWEPQTGAVDVCLRGIESLFPYHDSDLLYRFLNTILSTLQGAGAGVHMHLDAATTDERTASRLESLFTHVERPDGSEEEPEPTDDSPRTPPVESSAERPASSPDTSERTVEMSAAEIDAALEDAGVGILAFDGGSPYAVPMSFGYDANRRELYLQLGLFDESEKRARVEESPDVSLVVLQYERPDRWRSVVVDGKLAPLSERELTDRDAAATFANGKLASVDVFSMDPDDVSFSWFRLAPSSMSGRKSATF